MTDPSDKLGKQAKRRKRWLRLLIPAVFGVTSVTLAGLWFGGQVAAEAAPLQVTATGTKQPRVAGKRGAAGKRSGALAGYTLERPDLRVELPESLREVSGLTDVSQTEVACVQDEVGVIFTYDLSRRQVAERFHFGPAGDYEGLTRVGTTFYVLRSDGLLYEVEGLGKNARIRTHVLADLPKDNEGLGWDFRYQRLLIAPKSSWGKGKAYRDIRPIFAFDLREKTRVADPVLSIRVSGIESFAKARRLPLPKGGKRHPIKFRPASIAVHPVTRETFVISAVDQVLASFDERGTVTGYALLRVEDFRKPEGITFLPEGDLVIANEASGKEPVLMVFKWHR